MILKARHSERVSESQYDWSGNETSLGMRLDWDEIPPMLSACFFPPLQVLSLPREPAT